MSAEPKASRPYLSDADARTKPGQSPDDSQQADTERAFFDRFQSHSLKVQSPYFDAIVAGDKMFEVRKNDRAFQRGDMLYLTEWHRNSPGVVGCDKCYSSRIQGESGHYIGGTIRRWVSFVYAGDARFGGIEPGYVVLGLRPTGDFGE